MERAVLAFSSGGVEVVTPSGDSIISGFANSVEAYDWCDEHGYDPFAGLSDEWKQKNRESIERRRKKLACSDLPLFRENK